MPNITYTQLTKDKSQYELTGKCHEHVDEAHFKTHSRFLNSSPSNPARHSATKNYDKVGSKFNRGQS